MTHVGGSNSPNCPWASRRRSRVVRLMCEPRGISSERRRYAAPARLMSDPTAMPTRSTPWSSLSKPVGRQLAEVVVVPKEVGGLGSANRRDLVTARDEGFASGVPVPPHDTLLMPCWQKSEAGSSGSWSWSGTRAVVFTSEDPRRGSCRGVGARWPAHAALRAAVPLSEAQPGRAGDAREARSAPRQACKQRPSGDRRDRLASRWRQAWAWSQPVAVGPPAQHLTWIARRPDSVSS